MSESAAERVIACYEYRGDGEWFKIKRPTRDELDCDVLAEALNYESVPKEVRETAYDFFDGQPIFVDPESGDTEEAMVYA